MNVHIRFACGEHFVPNHCLYSVGKKFVDTSCLSDVLHCAKDQCYVSLQFILVTNIHPHAARPLFCPAQKYTFQQDDVEDKAKEEKIILAKCCGNNWD